MELPLAYDESPLDQEEVYSCKGCGEILEEGKAFELAGNRWHIGCFRCNTCNTLLDSDANLLLLGDGSLICNNCTYSCSACSNKIEDLAILTGDQAFCASCFVCRNCKKQIENLRYARTSQGIFCMTCHESLMSRKRRKAREAKKLAAENGPPAVLDKSLPALPPQAAMTVPQFTEADRDQLVGPESLVSASTLQSKDLLSQETSPAFDYPSRTSSKRGEQSNLVSPEPASEDTFDLPLGFDPTPPAQQSSRSRKPVGDGNDSSLKPGTRDYFTGGPSPSRQRTLKENEPSRSSSTEPDAVPPTKPAGSPHIAYQERGRQTSGDLADVLRKKDSRHNSATHSPAVGTERPERPRLPSSTHLSSYTLQSAAHNDAFKLQEVPKTKRSNSKRTVSDEQAPTISEGPTTTVSPVAEAPLSANYPSNDDVTRGQMGLSPASSKYSTSQSLDLPVRGDSLAARKPSFSPGSGRSPAGRSIQESPRSPSHPNFFPHNRKGSVNSNPGIYDAMPDSPRLNGGKTISRPVASNSSRSIMDAPNSSTQSSQLSATSVTSDDSFTQPRAVPPLPPVHKPNGSISTIHSDWTEQPPGSATSREFLPRQQTTGDISMDEDLARVMRGDDERGSLLRKASNAVKHGRSFSDRGAHSRTPSAKFKSPKEGQTLDISSPIAASPTGSPDGLDSVQQLRASLRRSQQRVVELETENNGLHEKIDSSSNLKQANTELREKRGTINYLDAQREILVRELEVMTDGMKRAKESGRPFELEGFTSALASELQASLTKLRDSLGPQIENLVEKRNKLNEEIQELMAIKDKGMQEYENLSNRNEQLKRYNKELLGNLSAANVPGFQQAQAGANGLGIYTQGKDRANMSMDSRTDFSSSVSTLRDPNMPLATPDYLGGAPHLLDADHTEPATIIAAPQVVNLRKAGKPGKTSTWRKNIQGGAKNITKNIKGAFSGDDRFPTPMRDGQYTLEGQPYSAMPSTIGGTPYERTESQISMGGVQTASVAPMPGRLHQEKSQSNFGSFFGQGKDRERVPAGSKDRTGGKNTPVNGAPVADASAVLFGSDLSARCEFEKRMIPAIILRCIEEVEHRGMDQEGIYRKSGAATVVKSIQQGFEKDLEFDISDEDLDIHAVTGAMKQYLRKLPNPLITFEMYDPLIHTANIPDEAVRTRAIREVFKTMPSHHRDVLQYIVQHLNKVMTYQSANLMTPHNVAVVFAPTIMRPLTVDRELTDAKMQRDIVVTILEQHQTIFADLPSESSGPGSDDEGRPSLQGHHREVGSISGTASGPTRSDLGPLRLELNTDDKSHEPSIPARSDLRREGSPANAGAYGGTYGFAFAPTTQSEKESRSARNLPIPHRSPVGTEMR